jgi:hypothetical protein
MQYLLQSSNYTLLFYSAFFSLAQFSTHHNENTVDLVHGRLALVFITPG